MLRKIRITLAAICFTLITLLFLDFTGTLHTYFGWLAKIQFLPAVLALNVGIILALIVLTLLLGRVYCSVICPLGVMQDIFGWLGRRGKKKRNRYSWSPAVSWLRYLMLAVLVVSAVAGVGSIVALLAPYSTFGRIAQNLLAPLWGWGNNLLALIAEHFESYSFYETDVWVRSWAIFGVTAATFVIIGFLAWRNGRTWCNTICPVGTVLGFLSRFSYLKPTIDTSKCNGCGLCGRRCKAACINTKEHTIDYSRCVSCMDCIENCHKHAIQYKHMKRTKPADKAKGEVSAQNTEAPTLKGAQVDNARRTFLSGLGILAATAAVKAQEKKVDGGMAAIIDKEIPDRKTEIVPPGAVSLRNLSQHCTGCQLCVAACPNGVLRPSTGLQTFMQPRSSYERGYCRPECVKCSEVCPAGAILKITPADKSAIQVGHAVWVRKNCIPLTDGQACGNCARHCPAGAITMVKANAKDPGSLEIPVVNTEKCIGCGACENLCPARPFSAIYVEGHETHREI